jgi:hypothetical protein
MCRLNMTQKSTKLLLFKLTVIFSL